jgi:hypothetical protein
VNNWNFPADWTAPAEDALEDTMLPLEVGDWERNFVSAETTIPVVNIDRETVSAVYAAEGSTFDVYVSRVSADERDAVFEQADTAIGNNTLGHKSIGSDNDTTRTLFFQTLGDGEQRTGWLVWNGGWLFLIHTTDLEPPILEFMAAFLSEIDAGKSQDVPSEIDPALEGSDADAATQPLPGCACALRAMRMLAWTGASHRGSV